MTSIDSSPDSGGKKAIIRVAFPSERTYKKIMFALDMKGDIFLEP
jgi:hypothetical protein